MPTDKEIARRSLDRQKRARDIPLMRIPGYMNWSEKQLADGVSADLIAHLDATSMWLLPEEITSVSIKDFDELLEDLRAEIDDVD